MKPLCRCDPNPKSALIPIRRCFAGYVDMTKDMIYNMKARGDYTKYRDGTGVSGPLIVALKSPAMHCIESKSATVANAFSRNFTMRTDRRIHDRDPEGGPKPKRPPHLSNPLPGVLRSDPMCSSSSATAWGRWTVS